MRFFRRGGSLRMLLDDDVTQPLNTLYRYAMQLMEVKEPPAQRDFFNC